MSTPNSSTAPESNERFVRWQKYLIDQMTFAQNLFLGLSVGALAFGVTLVKENGFSLPAGPRACLFVGLIALSLSSVAGCLAVVSRLLDFRNTVRKIGADVRSNPNDAAVFQDRY